MTQNSAILNHLKSGKSLTPLDALHTYGCLRLAARIDNLRSQGFVIETEIVRDQGKSYAKYFIPNPVQLDLAI